MSNLPIFCEIEPVELDQGMVPVLRRPDLLNQEVTRSSALPVTSTVKGVYV